MPKKPRIRKPHTSRRAPPLKDSDYDHEIALVEAEGRAAPLSPEQQQPSSRRQLGRSSSPAPSQGSPPSPQALRPDSGEGPSTLNVSVSTTEPLVAAPTNRSSSSRPPRRSDDSLPLSPRSTGATRVPDDHGDLTINVQQPTPFEPAVAKMSSARGRQSPAAAAGAESAIDVLYENERGGMLCGMPFFSSKALWWIDPPPWTNSAHKPSATSIHTAQVPDPSWAWTWPEWRVNKDEGVDKDGWEYSFSFYRKFSWHGPKWWNSYVRRRAWIRRRVKREQARGSIYGGGGGGGSLLQPEYFTVRSSAEMQRSSKELSRPGSARRGPCASSIISASAASQAGGGSMEGSVQMEIQNVDALLTVLRACRIDREKIEAVENYLANSVDDLARLDEAMHEIMAFCVFQASRRLLLKRLTELCEDAVAAAAADAEKPSSAAGRRAANLQAAVKHADEEVRRLEYWSDVKGIVEAGDDDGCCEEADRRDRQAHEGRSAPPGTAGTNSDPDPLPKISSERRQ